MKTKVKTVEQTTQWKTKTGDVMYTHQYELEDGTKIQANHKTINPFAIGDEVEYDVKKDDPQYGKSGSVKKPEQGNYGSPNAFKGNNSSNRSFALSYAKDVLVASYTTQRDDVLTLSTDQMFSLAEKMDKWLDKKEPKADPEKVKELVQSATEKLMDNNQH